MEKQPFQIFENKAEDFGKLFLEFSSVDLITKEFVIESAFFDEKYKKAADVRDGAPFKHIFESLLQYHDLPCVYQFDIAALIDAVDNIKNPLDCKTENFSKYLPEDVKIKEVLL